MGTSHSHPSLEALSAGLQALAMLGGTVYFLGFLTVNSFLLRFDYVDLELFRAKYLVVGCVVAFALFIFWFLPGRSVIHLKRYLDAERAQLTKGDVWDALSYLLSFVRAFADLPFRFCLAVATIVLLIFGDNSFMPLMAFLLPLYLALSVLDKFVDFRRVRAAANAVELVGKIVGIYMFCSLMFSLPGSHSAWALSGAFLLLALLANAVAESWEEGRLSSTPAKFNAGVHVVAVCVMFAVGFGAMMYEGLRPILGGPIRSQARIFLDPKLLEAMGLDGKAGLKAEILLETETNLLFRADETGSVFRVPQSAVLGIGLGPKVETSSPPAISQPEAKDETRAPDNQGGENTSKPDSLEQQTPSMSQPDQALPSGDDKQRN